MLAGVSADYYLQLERGRDRNPSPQVLESIARVLHLDDEALAHMLTLVTDVPRRRRRRPRQQTPPPGALKLLASLVQPAYIENRYFDVLASNALARAVDPRLTVGGNQLRELTGELTPASPRFRQLWAKHEVRGQTGGVVRFDHPQGGDLALNRERVSIAGAEGMMLVLFHPLPGSSDADKLKLLASAAMPSPTTSHKELA